MTISQIKREIKKSLEKVPETALKDVLAYLKQAQENNSDKSSLKSNLSKVLDEDKNLLQRLAK